MSFRYCIKFFKCIAILTMCLASHRGLAHAQLSQIVTTGENCLFNSDCRGNLVCEGRRCRQECRSSRDCDSDEICAQDPQPRGVPTSYVEATRACVKRSAYSLPQGYPIEEIPVENTNILGFDSEVVVLNDNDPALCYRLCKEVSVHGSCDAWAMIRSGVQGPAPYCWLKSLRGARVERVPDTNSVSGVVRPLEAQPAR